MTDWLPAEIEGDEKGFVKTGHAVAASAGWKNASHSPCPLPN